MSSATEVTTFQNGIDAEVDEEIKKSYLQQVNSWGRPWELANEVDLEAESSHLHQQLSKMDKTLSRYRPDFLIISPGKTGTTWLSQNLNHHPDIFIPKVKEIKYFSSYWHWCDINWYLRYFAGTTRLKKGEATPSYALLPFYVIKQIKLCLPEVKLIYLMRDPISRAWSHMKHVYEYHSSNFLNDSDFDNLPPQKFAEHFIELGALYHSDYLGCLKRWLTFFPKKQFFIGFYESIHHTPKPLLTDIFDFLGITQEVKWSKFPMIEKFQPSLKKEIPPPLKLYLRSIYKSRTEELCGFLKEQFTLEAPSEWANTLHGDELLTPWVIEQDYRGFRIALWQGKFYALSKDIALTHLGEAELKDYQQQVKCFAGNLPDEVKYLVDHYFSFKEEYLISAPLGEIHLSRPNLIEADLLSFNERLLTIASLGEIHSSEPCLIEADYRGFNIVVYKDKFYALISPLGAIDLTLNTSLLNKYQKNQHCFMAHSLAEIKQLVDQLSPQCLKKEFWGFHLVRYRGRYFALTKRLIDKVKRRAVRIVHTTLQPKPGE